MVNNLDFNATEIESQKKKIKRKKDSMNASFVQIRDLPQTQFPRKDVR